MKNKIILLLFSSILFLNNINAQLEKVIVEKYYVSDSSDASDNIGGHLAVGSTTYRVYVDLKVGSRLKKVYGDINHPLIIKSDSSFFNNLDRGQSFGKDFSKNHYRENTVALDSWITLGQVTKSGAKTYFGIFKTQDRDGTFVGGNNNDGGSASISSGLLTNNNPNAGIPLTTADGIDTMKNYPTSWANYGFLDLVSGVDSTIFGSAKIGKQFISYNAGVQNSGTTGVIPDSNQILVAQLTTKGELSFELNIEVEEPYGLNTKIVKYVANDSVLLSGEILNRYLKYPFVAKCGCPDPSFLEYFPTRDCDNVDSCKTKIIIGCMDTLACNYDPKANFNIIYLCCYPGYCNDRDLSSVCPSISNSVEFSIFPNPAQEYLNLSISSGSGDLVSYSIFDSNGILKIQKNLGLINGLINETININSFNNGMYLIRINSGNEVENKIFMKN